MSEEPFDLSGVFGIVSTLAINYARADRQLLLDSIDHPRRIMGSDLPFLQAVAGFRSKLKFDLTVDRNRGFLFDLFRTNRSERVAQMSLDFKVSPAPLSAARQDYAVALWGTWPPGPDLQSGQLVVPLPNAPKMFVSFAPDRDPDKTRVRLDGGRFRKFRNMPQAWRMDLLMSLARLARNTSKAAPHPMRTRRGDRLESFLTDVATGIGAALEKAAPVMRPDPANLNSDPAAARVGAVLGPHAIHYGFREINTILEVLLEPDGSIATEPFQEGAQRFSLSASLESTGRDPRLVLSLGIPDALCSGDLHAHLMEEFRKRSDEFWEEVPSPISDAFSGDVQFGQFLATAKTTIVRIKRNSDGHDLNMIIFEGSVSDQQITLVFQIELKLRRDASESALELEDLDVERLEGAKIGSGDWLPDHKRSGKLITYAHQVLLQIFLWRSRFAEGNT